VFDAPAFLTYASITFAQPISHCYSGIPPKEHLMRKFGQWLADFLKREDGPTAVEYAVMLALIIVVCITAITTLGTNANKTFTSVGNSLGSTSGS
jgi:pilus assembly protein Flp/PilA